MNQGKRPLLYVCTHSRHPASPQIRMLTACGHPNRPPWAGLAYRCCDPDRLRREDLLQGAEVPETIIGGVRVERLWDLRKPPKPLPFHLA